MNKFTNYPTWKRLNVFFQIVLVGFSDCKTMFDYTVDLGSFRVLKFSRISD